LCGNKKNSEEKREEKKQKYILADQGRQKEQRHVIQIEDRGEAHPFIATLTVQCMAQVSSRKCWDLLLSCRKPLSG